MKTELLLELTGHRKAVVLNTRDKAMLEFLWRHRVASFQAIYQIFFCERTMLGCYNRLRKLKRLKFVISKGIDGLDGRLWSLNDRGMAYVKREIGDLRNLAYKSHSPIHDHLVMSALLGDWYRKLPQSVEIITEQELLSGYPSEIPSGLQDPEGHRPDGLWKFKKAGNLKLVALEVEVSPKSDGRYTNIFQFYDNHYHIERVIWIVDGRSLLRRIHTNLLRNSQIRQADHLFILLEDFKKLSWAATFRNETWQKTSLAEFLQSHLSKSEIAGYSLVDRSVDSSNTVSGSNLINGPLLDLSGCFVNSAPYSKLNRRKRL
jgi:hypothetical protein